MARWQDVLESEEWHSATPAQKMQIKRDFWDNTITKSEKFTSQNPRKQIEFKNNFFGYNPKEGMSYREMIDAAAQKQIEEQPLARAGLRAVSDADKLVDMLADKVVGEIPSRENEAESWIKDFPRVFAGEAMRMYKPSSVMTALGLGAAAKAAKPLVKPVGKAIGKVIPQKLKDVFLREMTVGKGQPAAYQTMKKVAGLEKEAGQREAVEAIERLTTTPKPMTIITGKGKEKIIKAGGELPKSTQQYVGRIFRKETIESPALKAHPKYQELKAISDSGREIMDKWSNELIKSGIPKKQSQAIIEENIGKYMARMYESKLAKTGSGFGIKSLRLRLNGLKHRKDLSAETLRQMGEIKEPALPTYIRVKELSSSIANNKLFNQVANNPEWVANNNVTGKMIKMADTPTLGKLSGKWVVPEIATDINAITNVNKQAGELATLFGAYQKGLSAWKYGKVVLNPATHARNMMSNSMLLDLSGTNHIDQLKLFPKVMKDYLQKGPMYQQALKSGAIGGEFVGGDVKKLYDIYTRGGGGNLQKLMRAVKYPFEKAGNIYRAEEQLAKMVKFAHVLEKGGTAEKAAAEAQKWLFNYSKIPNIVKVGKHIAPFMTFTYKSLPRIAEAMVERPLSVYKYYAMINAFNNTSRKLQGMTPVEFARQKKALPKWLMDNIGGMPSNLLMPWTDKYGRTQWLNVEYILPVGMAPEIAQEGLMKGFVSNPLINIVADLKKNQDFKGSRIIPPVPTKEEAAKAVTEYVYRQLAPSLAPSIGSIKGGYSFEKIMDAINKRPDFAERTRELTPVLFDVLAGLKVNPLDVEEGEQFRMFDKKKIIDELQSEVFKLQHPAISEEERDKQLENIFKKMQQVMEQQ